MPKINFKFTGQVKNVEITKAIDLSTMRAIDVSNMSSKELLEKINDGDIALNFVDAYIDGGEECQMSDFEIPDSEEDYSEED